MRIAHVVSTYPPYRGGMGNVAAALVERTRTRGHDVRVVTPSSVRRLLRFGNAAWCPDIRRTLEAMQPDIVHLHWPFIGGVGAVLRWRRADKRRRLIVQYHMDLVGSGWRGAVFGAYQRCTLPRVVRAADRLVCSSRDYAEHGALAPFFPQLGERFAEIPLGVDVGRFHLALGPLPPGPLGARWSRGPDMASPVSPLGKQSSLLSLWARLPLRGEGGEGGAGLAAQCCVLFVGGLDRAHAFKGLPVLLAAVARVPDVRLWIVGDGDLRAQYEQQARVLGIADRVTFLGSIADDALPDAYRAADVLVLPSTARSEAFGLVLLEAMACGIPVIASDLPGVRTVVRNGETGWLVPPGDVAALAERLAWIATHRDEAQAMGARARSVVETRYDWDRIVKQWCAVYDDCSPSSRGGVGGGV